MTSRSVGRGTVRAAAELTGRAPSLHNTQPWRLRWAGPTIRLDAGPVVVPPEYPAARGWLPSRSVGIADLRVTMNGSLAILAAVAFIWRPGPDGCRGRDPARPARPAVRPRLAGRSAAVLAGATAPRSKAHHAYVALDVLKIAGLIALGVTALTPLGYRWSWPAAGVPSPSADQR